jgi:hypothetical protein
MEELKEKLTYLSSLLYKLPENDRKFIDGALKHLMEKFYGNPISNQLISDTLDKLVEMVREYSELIKEVRSNNIASPTGLTTYKESFRKYIKEFEKNVGYYLERVEKLEGELLAKYQIYSKKIKEDPNKGLVYAWHLSSDIHKIESNKKYNVYLLSKSFAYFVKNTIMYHLITTNLGENAYASGKEFVEKEITPRIVNILNKVEEFENVYKNIEDFSRSILEGNTYRNKEKFNTSIYLLIIFALIGGLLFSIGNKGTMMAVLTTHTLTPLLVLGVLVLLSLFFVKFIKSRL